MESDHLAILVFSGSFLKNRRTQSWVNHFFVLFFSLPKSEAKTDQSYTGFYCQSSFYHLVVILLYHLFLSYQNY